MQSIGCGGVHAANVLAHLGLPFCAKLHKNGFSNLQEEIGKAERHVSEESMRDALKEEIRLTKEMFGVICMYNGLVLIVVGFDMGWSKRSTGRRYDSRTLLPNW